MNLTEKIYNYVHISANVMKATVCKGLVLLPRGVPSVELGLVIGLSTKGHISVQLLENGHAS